MKPVIQEDKWVAIACVAAIADATYKDVNKVANRLRALCNGSGVMVGSCFYS